MGVRVGRGGRGRRPREGNDKRVDDLNGKGNDQGMRANGGVEGVNGNVERANGGAPDFSTIIAQQLQNLLPAMLAQVGNQGKVGNQNGNVVNENIQVNVRNVLVNGNRVGCSYKEFLVCNPKEYDGKGGVVVFTRWIKKMEKVQDMSGCSIDQKVKYTAGSFVEFCPIHEMQKLETELWNHATVGAGHTAYTDTFHELARLVPHLVKKRGNVGKPSKDKNGRDDNNRTRTGNVFATTMNLVGRENVGAWPKCATCNSYHAPIGPCRICFNCNRPGHLAKDCRGVPRNVNSVNARNPPGRACYECEQSYQAPTQQNQIVPLNELEKVKRINEANMKAVQTQINIVKNELRNEIKNSIQASLSNQTNEIKNMMASLFQMNTASTSGSGSLPSNTVANPKGEIKAITIRSGLVLNGPTVPTPPLFINPKEDERVEETLTEPDHSEDPLHPNIPYPSRMPKQKQQEKDEVQIHKFWQMFKQLHVNISLDDALILMPKYQKMLKSLFSIKEKLQELANIPLNKNCSAVILKKLLEKLGDPGKFLISCGFSHLKCKALADLGASINLMPLFVWKKLGLLELISTSITTRSGLILDGHSVPMPPTFINPKEDERVDETLTNPKLTEYTIKVPPPPIQKANLILKEIMWCTKGILVALISLILQE
nr:reverse transcriptase domain-containing protein [Tanacetum cinerariifolium]